MPEKQYAARIALKTRAIDNVGAAFSDRLQEPGIVARIIFQIGILNYDYVPRYSLEPAPERSTLAGVTRQIVNNHTGNLFLHLLEHISSAVSATIVNNNKLVNIVLAFHPSHALHNRGLIVVRGDYYRQAALP